MLILKILITTTITIYLLAGFVYAFYLEIKGSTKLRYFLLNMITGPFYVYYIWHSVKTGKRTSFNEPRRKNVRILEGKKAVFFDLDGTLADTAPLWKQAMESVLSKQDLGVYSATGFFKSGDSMDSIWESVLAYSQSEDKPKVKDLVDQTNAEFIKLLPNAELQITEGFWDLITDLKVAKKLKVGLLSNTPENVVLEVTKKLEIQSVFDILITGDQVKNRKPNPEIYLKAAKNLNIKPKEALVFEDSVIGATAADKAGMSIIIVWNREKAQYEYPQSVYEFIADFESILGFLDKSYNEVLAESLKAIRESRKS